MVQQQPAYTYYRQPQPQMMTPQLKGHLVSSIDEAKAATIDFDGNIFFFPDLPNKRIYTKQVNMDGTVSFNLYELTQMPDFSQVNPNDYITREEFRKAILDLKTGLTSSTAQAGSGAQNPGEYNF